MVVFRRISGVALALLVASFVYTAPDAQGASKLYDMDRMLGQGNPLDVPPAAPPSERAADTGAARPAPTQFRSQLYDMDRMLNERNPFDTSPVAQAPIRSRAAPIETAQTPPAKPVTLPSASGPKAADADPTFPDLDNYDAGMENLDVDGRDPLETVNRGIFAFNEFVYKYFLTPLAKGYNAVMPEPVRDGISHAISNLNGPVVLANDLLQGEFKRAGTTTARFAINSTLGFLGTIDVASDLGFEKHSEDFGQTMGAWGVGEGFYLVLPLLGPTNPRDAIGKFLVDGYFDPLGYYLDDTDNQEWGYVRSGVGGFVEYSEIVDDLENLRETSVDFYGALRSLYRQRRAAEIRNQEQGAVPSLGGGR